MSDTGQYNVQSQRGGKKTSSPVSLTFKREEMAFLDNPAIILAHIRQSHVTSDDTGMCEMVLIDQDVDLEKFQPAFVHSSSCGSTGSGSLSEGGSSMGDSHACDLSQSMDITSSWDFGIRRRSNTGQLISRVWLVYRTSFLPVDLPAVFMAGEARKHVLLLLGGVCVFNLGQWFSEEKDKSCGGILKQKFVAVQEESMGLDHNLLCECH